MRSLLEVWRPFEIERVGIRGARERASRSANKISEAILAAELSGREYYEAAYTRAFHQDKMTQPRREAADRLVKVAAWAHLRDCALTAHEMQKGLSDALGSWVLSECTAGTGLSGRELKTLIEVSGGVVW